MKTTNIRKTKPNKTKAWFRSPFTPPGEETVGRSWGPHGVSYCPASTTTWRI